MKIQSLNDIRSLAAYLRRIGAEARSLKSAVVKERQGNYFTDISVITVSKTGKIDAPPAFAPTEEEEKAVAAECGGVVWPEPIALKRLINLPPEIEAASAKNVFEFKNISGEILMLHLRVENETGKSYFPYTYWDDQEWRRMEPEGLLPLWGVDKIKDKAVIFIHEGAKAARTMREMVERETPAAREKLAAHPWSEELSAGAAHVGWIGGALAAHRTDWKVLNELGFSRVYIVSDNDKAGVAAVSTISKALRMPTFHVQFTRDWPASFDLGDDFPTHMFEVIDGLRYYNGPPFRHCIHPATWATDVIPMPKGRPQIVLRSNFRDQWSYINDVNLYVNMEIPEIMYPEEVANKVMAPFSDSSLTTKMISRSYHGNYLKLCYRPDLKGKHVAAPESSINLHTPTDIRSSPGDPKPFIDFMNYMFVNEKERHQVMRWCATLIARLEVHMEYGLLLVSAQQGTGKTTLGASILAHLVGPHNASYPSESQIVKSDFNGWIANKRLCVVNEIYSGHSWKAYNELKSAITDKEISVNEKFEKSYTVKNWIHIFACSNSLRALKMDEDDRRWFYPEVTEEKWSRENFDKLHKWISSGGLGIIKTWAENFGDYVKSGEMSPATERKRELIRSSRSEAQQEVVELAAAMNRVKFSVVSGMKEVVSWSRATVKGVMHDSDLELRKAMKESGVFWLDERFLMDNRLQFVCFNDKTLAEIRPKFDLKVIKNNVTILVEEKEKRSEVFDLLREIHKREECRLENILPIRM